MKTSTILCVLCCITLTANAEKCYKRKPLIKDPWVSDSLFVGAEIAVIDSAKPVMIKVKASYISSAAGSLYYINSTNDSVIFLSTNKNFDSVQVNIGSFPNNTILPFMFIVTDTSSRFAEFRNLKIYTGQNRKGVDSYISQREMPPQRVSGYGARWSLAGNVGSDKVEVGFEERGEYVFRGIVFEVSNVQELHNRHKLPLPRYMKESSFLALHCPAVPDTLIIGKDSTFFPCDTTKLQIYYTLDNSDPRSSSSRLLYTSPIPITQTTTIKSYTFHTGDTNWLQSDIATATYTTTTVRNSAGKNSIIQNNAEISGIDPARPLRIYDMQGKLVAERYTASFMAMRPALRAGLYFLHYSAPGAGVQVRKVLVAD
jgi:hypothetical protein